MAVQTNRTRALTNIAGMMPVANRSIADGLQSARMMGVQQAVQQAAPAGVSGSTGATSADIQSQAAKITSAGGAINDQVQKTGQQTAFELGRGAEAEQGAANTAELTKQKAASSARATRNEATLSALGQQAKAQVFDAQMQFQRDQNKQLVLNDQQLADWTATKAKSAEDLKNREQQVTQASDRAIQMMQAAAQKLDQQLQIETQKKIQERDNRTIAQLTQQKQAVDKAIAAQQAKAANRQAEYQAIGSVLGSPFGPQGAAVGAGLGSVLASTT